MLSESLTYREEGRGEAGGHATTSPNCDHDERSRAIIERSSLAPCARPILPPRVRPISGVGDLRSGASRRAVRYRLIARARARARSHDSASDR